MCFDVVPAQVVESVSSLEDLCQTSKDGSPFMGYCRSPVSRSNETSTRGVKIEGEENISSVMTGPCAIAKGNSPQKSPNDGTILTCIGGMTAMNALIKASTKVPSITGLNQKYHS